MIDKAVFDTCGDYLKGTKSLHHRFSLTLTSLFNIKLGYSRLARLSHSLSGALRTFSFWVANGTMGLPILEGIDYRQFLMREPSLLEAVYAVFANTLELDDKGNVLNAKQAERRAAQLLRAYCEPKYWNSIVPPFEDWETELHSPPPIRDPAPNPDLE